MPKQTPTHAPKPRKSGKPAANTVTVTVPAAVPAPVVAQVAPGLGTSRNARRRRALAKNTRGALKSIVPAVIRSTIGKASAAAVAESSRKASASELQQAAKRLMLSVVAPNNPQFTPERLADIYTNKKTGVASAHAVELASFSVEGSTEEPREPNSSMRFTFHDPVRNTVTSVVGEIEDALYNLYMSNLSSAGSTDPATNVVMMVGLDPEPLPVRYGQVDLAAGASPHGDIWAPGTDEEDGELAFFYMQGPGAHDDIALTWSWDNSIGGLKQPSALTGLSLVTELLLWNGRKTVKVGEYAGAITAISTPVTLNVFDSVGSEVLAAGNLPPGYYAVRLRAYPYQGSPAITPLEDDAYIHVAAEYTYTASAADKLAFWAHKCMPGMLDHLSTTKDVRMLGTAGMVTASSALINTGGTVVQYQVPRTDPWFLLANQTVAELSTTYEDIDTRKAETGAYGFIRPASEDFFEMTSPVAFFGVLRGLTYSLRPKDEYLVQMVTMPLPAGSTQVPVGSAYFTTFNAWEYVTTDVWATVEFPMARAKDVEDWVESLKSVTQWHDNPDHLSDIFREIFGWAKWVGSGVSSSASALGKIWLGKKV